jgi:serine/threonine-protein kinase RsbW
VIEVRDHGRWNEEPSEPHRGRGMAIMRAVAGDVGVERSSAGTTITIMRRLDQTTS